MDFMELLCAGHFQGDHHGQCTTQYQVTQLRHGGREVVRTKNLAACEKEEAWARPLSVLTDNAVSHSCQSMPYYLAPQLCVVPCKVIIFSAKDVLEQTLYFSVAYTHKDTGLFLRCDGTLMYFVCKHYVHAV